MKDRKIREYDGGTGIRVRYDVRRCIHAAECVRRLPAVFDPNRRPWARPEHADPDEVADVIGRCPSGALSYERADDGDAERPAGHNSIRVTRNGPLYVCGDVVIQTSDGRPLENVFRAALCRCGDSSNKPFCDGSHEKMNWTDAGTLGLRGVVVDESRSGRRLEIRLADNGPLLVSGDVTVLGASGDESRSGTKVALCRCGHSGNKPFCDGTHRSVDFNSD